MTPAVDTKTKIYSSKIQGKRNARILGIQCLYAYEAMNCNIDVNQLAVDVLFMHDFNVLNIRKHEPVNKKYLLAMIRGAINDLEYIDQKTSLYIAQDWKVERLPKLVKNIIRLGIYELINNKELTKPMIIDEYLEIAKLFKHEGEVGFINSVLDSLAREHE